jgi:hypothetical protein
MTRLRSILGYTAAVLSFVVMVGAFPALEIFGEPLITATGLTVSPNYTGGEVTRTIDYGAYQMQVHRMVFDDVLIGERRTGFIQVDWSPLEGLPARIDEAVDVDGDGQADFRVEVDTLGEEATLTPHATWVLDVDWVYRLEDALALRVRLRNPHR